MGLALDPRGLIVADSYNDRIRLVTREGEVTTLAGRSGPGLQDGVGMEVAFDTPTGVADAGGSVYVADTGNDAIRRIDQSGLVTTLSVTGPALAGLSRPTGIAAMPDGRLYVADRRSRVLEVDPGGRARLLAGGSIGFANGVGGSIRFRNPTGIAVTAGWRTGRRRCRESAGPCGRLPIAARLDAARATDHRCRIRSASLRPQSAHLAGSAAGRAASSRRDHRRGAWQCRRRGTRAVSRRHRHPRTRGRGRLRRARRARSTCRLRLAHSGRSTSTSLLARLPTYTSASLAIAVAPLSGPTTCLCFAISPASPHACGFDAATRIHAGERLARSTAFSTST